jgi:hypothetical protein
MPEHLMIRERPPHSGVVALLEAEGLPVSDLTEAHLQHFFFTGSDGAPSALVGLELTNASIAAPRHSRSKPRASSRASARRAPSS